MSQKLSLLDVQEKIKALQEEIKAERSNGLDMKQVFEYVGKHIERLHDYNDIKDIGQELMGQLAQRRGLTTADLYPEFEVDLED
ncbi:DNA repair protein [Gorgonomyces haynaldii]|nr:DNA repair protein [Gorgonomyces haynaldii]